MIHPQFKPPIFIVALATLFCLVACNPTVFSEKDIPCELESGTATISQSSPLDIDLHIDGSGSMLGYTTFPSSRYIQTLELLDSVFLTKNSRDKVNLTYYRAGGKESQPIDRSQYRKASKPEFYNGTNSKFEKVSSALAEAITAPKDNDKLLVLVTDLQQDEGDVNNLIKQLKEHYQINQGKYSIGVLGIKSEFKGTVYTVNPDLYQDFDYSSNEKDPVAFRPFYVIMVAPYEDLIYYYEALRKGNKDLMENSQFTIFSPQNFIKENPYLDTSSPLPNEIDKPESLQIGKLVFEPNPNPSRYTLLEIPKNIDQKEIDIPFSLPISPLDYSLNPEEIEIQITPKSFDVSSGKFIEKSAIKQALEIKDLNLANSPFTFTTQIKPESFPEPGLYLFTVDFTLKSLQDADWWKDWNWEPQKNDQDGSKTYNFLYFMKGLKNLMVDERAKPSLSRFCYAVQKN